MSSLRWKKRLIALAYHSFIIGATLIGWQKGIDGLVYVGIFDLLTFKYIPRYIQMALIATVRCSSCHQTINLKNYWGCNCGYTTQIPRHIFQPCLQCKNEFSFLSCQFCGLGILV